MLNIAAIVVVYNKNISESITCDRLLKLEKPELRVIVVDNSEKENKNKEYCNQSGIDYLSMNGNKGLSKAYNRAIEYCKKIETDVVILFDDDTEIIGAYFDKLEENLLNLPDVDIFAPVIYGQDGVIYSPNEFNFMRNHFIDNKNQEISQEAFNAIASCLAIRMRVFTNYSFNETLFVDQVDQYFFYEQRQKKARFTKMDIVIQQNFYQRASVVPPQVGWNRLRLRIIDIMRQTRLMGSSKYAILGYIKCCGLGVQIARKAKSPAIAFKAIGLATKSWITRM